MKIGIFHPQINYYGGGEMVALTIANILSKKYEVEVLTESRSDKKNLEKFFCINLDNINFKVRRISMLLSSLFFVPNYKRSIQLKYLRDLSRYDLVIDTGTNGWFSKKLACKTICYIHFPYFKSKKKGWRNIFNFLLIDPKEAFKYDRIICNSNFTKESVSQLTDQKIEIIYPPVNVNIKKQAVKKNRIVTVGRFTYEKKHEILIEAFKKLRLSGWELHLVGSFQKNVKLYDVDYLNHLKELAKGHNIFFHINMPHDNVLKFLSNCKIYWHARGYGETDPHEYENFGISTVEAMAAGCLPIVINKGAQPEIVRHGKSGYVWDKPEDLIKFTYDTINNPRKSNEISEAAVESSKKYDIEVFSEKILKLVKEI